MSFQNVINQVNMRMEARQAALRRQADRSRFGKLNYSDNVKRIADWRASREQSSKPR